MGIDVPRDRDGSFEPKIVGKRKRRLSGIDELVLSLSAKGLTTGEVAAHLAEVYGADVSRQTISTITDKVIEGMAECRVVRGRVRPGEAALRGAGYNDPFDGHSNGRRRAYDVARRVSAAR